MAVIEGALLLLILFRPNQGFMGIGKADASEIGHRVAFDPYYVIKDPIAQILHCFTNCKDIMIGADDPNGACVFQYPLTLGQPSFRKIVILIKISKLVPVSSTPLTRVCWVCKAPVQLQVIGGSAKSRQRFSRKSAQYLNTIPMEQLIFDIHASLSLKVRCLTNFYYSLGSRLFL